MAAPAVWSRKPSSGRPGVTVRSNYVEPPFDGLDEGRMNGGQSRPDECPAPEATVPGPKSPRWSAERRALSARGRARRSRKAKAGHTKAPFGALPPRISRGRPGRGAIKGKNREANSGGISRADNAQPCPKETP